MKPWEVADYWKPQMRAYKPVRVQSLDKSYDIEKNILKLGLGGVVLIIIGWAIGR